MTDKTGQQRSGQAKETTREGKGVGSRRSLEPRYVFFTLLTFITYRLRATATTVHHHHDRRLVGHNDDHMTHQNGSTTMEKTSKLAT